MKREHCVAAVLDREMEKKHTDLEKCSYGKGTGLVSPSALTHSIQVTANWQTPCPLFPLFFLVFLSADLCLLSCRTQLWHLTCNPIKQANIIAPYVGCQRMCTQPTHNWVLATWWCTIHTGSNMKILEAGTICWTARNPSGDWRGL